MLTFACAFIGLAALGAMLAPTSPGPASQPVGRGMMPSMMPSMVPAAPGGQAAPPVMEKYVSKEAIFLLYKPRGWVVSEGSQPTFRTITVSDPAGASEAAVFFGTNPLGNDVMGLTRRFAGGIGRQYPNFAISGAMVSRDRSRIVFNGTFTHPRTGNRELRCWVSGHGNEFLYNSVEVPAGQMGQRLPLLLTILANVRPFKGAFAGGAGAQPVQVTLEPYRLSDGSASFEMPQGWRCKEMGKGTFLAGDPAGQYAFTVDNVPVITPQLGVQVQGVPVFPYQSPSSAMKTLGAWHGSVRNVTFESVIPRQDVAEAMGQVYTAGPVQAEEFLYTCDTRVGRTKGYTFGFTFGSRLNTSWSFRHLTVMAPADRFDAFVGNFVSMLRSYRINETWARMYVEQGMARLRQMQRQTAAMVSRNAQEIHDMMQAAYDERQRSQDYIDYQRTTYIRGEQDWISHMEGGTVYHSDAWGTKNTTTGEYWEGQPYDYVNYTGRNPKYNEDMTPVNSRELWERYVR